jgi:hypothetical protein
VPITTNPPPPGSNAARNEAAYGDPYSRPSPTGGGSSHQDSIDTARTVTESLNQSAQRSGSDVRFTVQSGINPTVTKSEVSRDQPVVQQQTTGGTQQQVQPSIYGSSISHQRTPYPNESSLPPGVVESQFLPSNRFVANPGTISAASNQNPGFFGFEVARFEQSTYKNIGLSNPERANPSNILPELAGRGVLLSYGAGKGVLDIPKSIINTPESAFNLVTKPGETFDAFSQQLVSSPEITIGGIAGQTAILSWFGNKGIPLIKDAYVGIGSKYIPPENVFSSQVLIEGKQFPLASNIPEVLARFESGGNIVSTASPKALSGSVAGFGSKGGLPVPFEDPGIFVTPKGEGSPAFLGLGESQGYSFNPLNSLKGGIPTVSEFKVSGVSLQPRSVVSQPGFGAVSDFLQSKAGSGEVFITKRSEIGLGNIPRQFFVSDADFVSPFPRTVQRGGNVVSGVSDIQKGDILREAGTSEIEGIIPPGSKFGFNTDSFLGKIKGFDSYTKYSGRNVAIREGELLVNPEPQFPSSLGGSGGRGQVIGFEQLQRENSGLSQLSNPSRSIIPGFPSFSFSRFSDSSELVGYSVPSGRSVSVPSLSSSMVSDVSGLSGGSSGGSSSFSLSSYGSSGLGGSSVGGGSSGGGSSPISIFSAPSSPGSSIPSIPSIPSGSFSFSGFEKMPEEKRYKSSKARKNLMVFPISSPQDIAITSMFSKRATSPGRNKLKEFKLSRSVGTDMFPTYEQRTPGGKRKEQNFLRRGFL